eukprot:7848044-Pyramimonas_sp.AAC.2
MTCGRSINCSSCTVAGIVASEPASAPAISRRESAGTSGSSTNSICAGCPAIGIHNRSAKLISSWPM